jgi:hypothetical protein
MRWRGVLIVAVAAVVFAGCASDDRDWMKLNEKYTIADFQRDLKTCTKNDTVDDACMKRLGWVSVSKGRDEKPSDPYGSAQQGRSKVR